MMQKLSSSYVILIVILGSITITTVLADTVTISTYPYTIQDGSSNQRLVITSSGNVGIGTANPQYMLDTAGNIHSSGNLILDGNSWIKDSTGFSNTGMDFGFGTQIIRSASDGHMEFNSQNGNFQFNGNVGIGTTSPAQQLDVEGNIRLTGNIVSPNDICIGSC